jgi:hypothetical protein
MRAVIGLACVAVVNTGTLTHTDSPWRPPHGWGKAWGHAGSSQS